MDLRGMNLLQAYRESDPFSDGQYVEHATFGQGYVMAILWPPRKMEVLFGDRTRVMLCGQGSAPASAMASTKPDKTKRAPTASTRRMARGFSPRASAGSATVLAPRAVTGPTTCPMCKRTVHPLNLAVATDGRVVGCMYCR
jgi:hypothetical protein